MTINHDPEHKPFVTVVKRFDKGYSATIMHWDQWHEMYTIGAMWPMQRTRPKAAKDAVKMGMMHKMEVR